MAGSSTTASAAMKTYLIKELRSKPSWANAMLLAGFAVAVSGTVQTAMITPVQSDIRSAQSDIRSITYRMGVMEGRMNRMEGDIQDIKRSIQVIERSIQDLERGVKSMMERKVNEGQKRESS